MLKFTLSKLVMLRNPLGVHLELYLMGWEFDDGMGVVSVFSAVVGDSFDGTEVIATMVTTADGRMNITYRDHADGFEIQAGNFMWSPKALAFKRGFGPHKVANWNLKRSYTKGLIKPFCSIATVAILEGFSGYKLPCLR